MMKGKLRLGVQKQWEKQTILGHETDISDKGFEPDMSNEHDTSRLF